MGLSCVVVCVVELLQENLVVERSGHWDDILVGWAGSLGGGLLTRALGRRIEANRDELERQDENV